MIARLACALVLFGCHQDPPAPTLGGDLAASAAADPLPQTDDVSALYSITKDDDIAGINRRVEVVLFKRVKQQTLEAICRRIHAADAHQHEITFLFFDVRGEPKPTGFAHWAIARFEPDLFAQILGDE
jgi:hypothetical protein